MGTPSIDNEKITLGGHYAINFWTSDAVPNKILVTLLRWTSESISLFLSPERHSDICTY